MMIFKQSEATAARRRIPFVCVDSTDNVTAEPGLSFSAGDLKINKNNATAANHGGTIVEDAAGGYWYEFTQAELDTIGVITLRTNKTGVANRIFAAQVINNDLNGNVTADIKAIDGDTDVDAILKAIYLACPTLTVNTTPNASTTTTSVVAATATSPTTARRSSHGS